MTNQSLWVISWIQVDCQGLGKEYPPPPNTVVHKFVNQLVPISRNDAIDHQTVKLSHTVYEADRTHL